MSACGYSEAEDQVFLQTVTPTSVRLFVASDGEFKWEDPMSGEVADCGNGTVNNTDSVEVTDYNDTVDSTTILDLRRRFGPGKTPESSGKSEIEVSMNGGAGNNTLQVWGGKKADNIIFGIAGVALNRDGDVDITQINVDDFVFLGKGGSDFLSANGGNGTEEPWSTRVTIYGNDGHDEILGSTADDRLLGSDGDDTMRGGKSGDIIFGNAGADLLLGRDGGDELDGMGGPDRLRGHTGQDDLEGGAGIDNCDGGSGDDTVATCETGAGD